MTNRKRFITVSAILTGLIAALFVFRALTAHAWQEKRCQPEFDLQGSVNKNHATVTNYSIHSECVYEATLALYDAPKKPNTPGWIEKQTLLGSKSVTVHASQVVDLEVVDTGKECWRQVDLIRGTGVLTPPYYADAMAAETYEVDCGNVAPPVEMPTATPSASVSSGINPVVNDSTQPPICPDGTVLELVANPHVLRAGDSATVNFFITKGDSANIYWKEVGASNWQHALADVKPNTDRFVSQVIGGLNPALGYTFGIQQKQGCGGGQIATAVIVDGPEDRLFHFSYWEW